MARPVIFTISAAWDDEASVWTGHCDDIPAAADAPTLDELLAKISAMALDLLPERAGCRVNGTAIRQGAARGAGWFPEHVVWYWSVFRHPEVRAKRASKGDGPGRASFEGRFAAASG